MSRPMSGSTTRKRPSSKKGNRGTSENMSDYSPGEFGRPMALSAQVQTYQTRIKMLELVNEELLKAKSEFSFLTPYEFADLMKQSKIDISKNFHDFGVNRLRKLEETLMKYVKQLAEARDLIQTLSRAQPETNAVDEEEIQAYKDQISTFKKAAKRSENEKTSLREELEQTRVHLSQVQAQVTDLTTNKAELTKKISDVQKRNSDFRADIRDKTKGLQNEREAHKETKDSLVSALAQLDDLKYKLDAGKTRRLKDARLENDKLKAAKSDLDVKTRSIEERDELIRTLRAQLKDDETAAAQTKTELTLARTELQEQAIQIDSAHEEIRKLEATLRQERLERKNQLMWDQNSLRDDIRAKNTECQELKSELEDVRMQLNAAKTKIKHMSDTSSSQDARASQEKTELKQSLAAAHDRVSILSDEKHELQRQVNDLKTKHFNEMSDKKAELSQVKTALADMTNRLHEAQDEVKDLREQVAAQASDLRVYQTSGTIDPAEHRRILSDLADLTKREADGRVMITELQEQLEEEREERLMQMELDKASKQRFR